MLNAVSLAACSMSASSKTIVGLFPPSLHLLALILITASVVIGCKPTQESLSSGWIWPPLPGRACQLH
jgi:hypothetical protein